MFYRKEFPQDHGPRLRAVTLGCKVNQYETQLVREGLMSVGYRDAQAGQTADICLVNTCTVTREGDAKSRQTIRRLARDNPGAQIVVMGCYATRDPETVSSLPGVSEVIVDKRELPDWLGRFGVVDVPTGISHFTGRQRAYVKVQDGCLLHCSYCIIPQVRPVMTSRPGESIVREVQTLIANGYREIVLTGIHLGHYGVDRNRGVPRHRWERLAGLLEQLCELPGEFRLRLSSIEATEVTRPLLEVMAAHSERVCPHLHVCLQSGSDAVLRRMRRRWGVKRFVDRCALVTRYLDRPALTTDVIVGFPGESEADFEDTQQVCREVGFSKIHIFPFSARRGTEAARMADRVDPGVQSDRCRRLAAVERELRREYFQGLLGRSLQVLIEGSADSHSSSPEPLAGTSCRYATVVLSHSGGQPGQLVQVRPTRASDSWLTE